MESEFTVGEGLRERAEASLGRERRMQLQSWFQDLLTHAADAKDEAGSLERMMWRRSSFISASPVRGALGSLLVWEDDFGSRIAWSIVDSRALSELVGLPNYTHKLVSGCVWLS